MMAVSLSCPEFQIALNARGVSVVHFVGEQGRLPQFVASEQPGIVTLLVGKGRGTSPLRNFSDVVFPHSGAGEMNAQSWRVLEGVERVRE